MFLKMPDNSMIKVQNIIALRSTSSGIAVDINHLSRTCTYYYTISDNEKPQVLKNLSEELEKILTLQKKEEDILNTNDGVIDRDEVIVTSIRGTKSNS